MWGNLCSATDPSLQFMARWTAAGRRLGSSGAYTWVRVKGKQEGGVRLINNTLYLNKAEQGRGEPRGYKENGSSFFNLFSHSSVVSPQRF